MNSVQTFPPPESRPITPIVVRILLVVAADFTLWFLIAGHDKSVCTDKTGFLLGALLTSGLVMLFIASGVIQIKKIRPLNWRRWVVDAVPLFVAATALKLVLIWFASFDNCYTW